MKNPQMIAIVILAFGVLLIGGWVVYSDFDRQSLETTYTSGYRLQRRIQPWAISWPSH